MKDNSFRDFVLDQLQEMPGLESRAMFGGFGLYAGEKIFGIILKGRLYFKTSHRSRVAYVARGMKPFCPNVKQRLNSYYEVPPEVIEDAMQIGTWGREASNLPGK